MQARRRRRSRSMDAQAAGATWRVGDTAGVLRLGALGHRDAAAGEQHELAARPAALPDRRLPCAPDPDVDGRPVGQLSSPPVMSTRRISSCGSPPPTPTGWPPRSRDRSSRPPRRCAWRAIRPGSRCSRAPRSGRRRWMPASSSGSPTSIGAATPQRRDGRAWGVHGLARAGRVEPRRGRGRRRRDVHGALPGARSNRPSRRLGSLRPRRRQPKELRVGTGERRAAAARRAAPARRRARVRRARRLGDDRGHRAASPIGVHGLRPRAARARLRPRAADRRRAGALDGVRARHAPRAHALARSAARRRAAPARALVARRADVGRPLRSPLRFGQAGGAARRRGAARAPRAHP